MSGVLSLVEGSGCLGRSTANLCWLRTFGRAQAAPVRERWQVHRTCHQDLCCPALPKEPMPTKLLIPIVEQADRC